jgi:hypothetical protein
VYSKEILLLRQFFSLIALSDSSVEY